MQARTRAWLIGIIVLFVACFQIVFEPLRFAPRTDPLRAGEEVAPAATVGPLFIYPPVPTVNLGLDLRGGIHVVLKARSQAVLTYEFAKAIAPEDTDRVEMQGIVAQLLSDIGEVEGIDIATKAVSIRVQAEERTEAERYQELILERLKDGLGKEYGPVEATSLDPIQMTRTMLSQVKDILEQRVNRLGLAETILQTEGSDRIIVKLPGITDPEQALGLIRSTAQLEFRHVPRRYQVAAETEDSGLQRVYFTDEAGRDVPEAQVIAESPVIVRGDQLKPNAYVDHDASGFPYVHFELKPGPEGAEAFHKFTRTHRGQHLAIVLDNRVISAPVVKAAIKTEGIIEGIGTTREAQQLAVLLNSGALPIPLDVEESRTVSATLGKDSLIRSMWAGLVGLIAVLIFMVAYYRLPGLLADLALIIYCLLVLAVLKMFGTTLTLPGIFGIILSIGMAVDANVIIFERLKEELRAQKTLKSAVEAGFNRAWTAILDSNVCSILTALVLIGLTPAAVKGFAVTLLIGVACSLFTAVTITRLFMNMTASTKAASKLSWFGV
ncbi:MAG: protein translocase subunit SecD [Armatimonadota bacterium]|nr:MAG: protein translocase subunit SecD [Armatimonadota bacterium]